VIAAGPVGGIVLTVDLLEGDSVDKLQETANKLQQDYDDLKNAATRDEAVFSAATRKFRSASLSVKKAEDPLSEQLFGLSTLLVKSQSDMQQALEGLRMLAGMLHMRCNSLSR